MLIRTLDGGFIPESSIRAIVCGTDSPRCDARSGVCDITRLDGSRTTTSLEILHQTLVQLVPCEGWTCLGTHIDEQGRPDGVTIHPMVAWTLNILGDARPYTADRVHEMMAQGFAPDMALRYWEGEAVFDWKSRKPYPRAAAWVKVQQQHWDKLEARQREEQRVDAKQIERKVSMP
jgi:hypothetical protein